MNTINACNIHNENTNISDILIANETSPEALSCQEISRDIIDSAIKVSINPIKVFQKAGSKISDIIIEKCDNLSRNISSMDSRDLHNLSPLQYPLFNEVKTTDYSLVKTSLFIGTSVALVLFMRYRKKNVNNIQVIRNIENINNSHTKPNVVKDEDIEIISDNSDSFKKSSHGIFTNWFGFNSLY